jgi:membrane-bound inhibitor of C-type lysozyme
MNTHTRRSLTVLAALGAVVTVPTSALAEVDPPGDIPDNQAFVVQTGPGYVLKTPEGWARISKAAVQTFSDKYNSIQVQIAARKKAPTIASVKSTDVSLLKTQVKGFKVGQVTKITRPAGQVILLTYRATSAPNAVTGKTVTNDVEHYVFWKKGKAAVLTLQAPQGSDNVDPWKLVTDSFKWAK